MIVNPGQTAFRYIGQQFLFPGDEPSLSFELESNSLSENISFGFCEREQYPSTIDSFSLKSGLIFDKLSRMIGTYQSGLNTFNYSYGRDDIVGVPTSNFRINQRLVYVNQDFPEIGEYAFIDSFFLANKGTSAADFNLNVSGFHPPIAFGRLLTQDYVNFTGEMYHPSMVGYNYRLMGVSPNYQFLSSTGIPAGGYLFTASGNFVLTGSAGPSQVIPITLDFDFGTYVANFEVASTGVAGGTGIGGGGNGFYLNLEGTQNEIQGGQSANYEVYFYSTNTQYVTIEMNMSSGSSLALLSGNAIGEGTFQGYVNGSGYVYSDRLVGYADFSDPSNAGYNSQYQTIPNGITVQSLGSRSVFAYFTGQSTYNWVGLPMQAYYFNPGDVIASIYYGTGYGSITANFIESDNGVKYFDGFDLTGIIPQLGNPAFPPPGSDFDPTTATIVSGLNVTGKGYISVVSGNIPFLGYGLGGVTPAVAKVPVTATGIIGYTGDSSLGYQWTQAGPNKTPNGGQLGSFYLLTGDSGYGSGYYDGNLILATGGAGLVNYFYPRGQSFIQVNSAIQGLTQESLEVITGVGQHTTLGEVTGTFTGQVFGSAFIMPGTYTGPIFSGLQDQNLYDYTGYGKNGTGIVKYGRGIVSGFEPSLAGTFTGIGLWFPTDSNYALYNKSWVRNVSGENVNFYGGKIKYGTFSVTPFNNTTEFSQFPYNRVMRTRFPNETPVFNEVYLTSNSPSEVSYSGIFDGYGWGTGVGGYPFDLYTGDGTSFISFRDYGYTGAGKYIKQNIPMGPGFYNFDIKVLYSPEIPLGNADSANLKVYTNTYTGEVKISGFGNA